LQALKKAGASQSWVMQLQALSRQFGWIQITDGAGVLVSQSLQLSDVVYASVNLKLGDATSNRKDSREDASFLFDP
jgi:hypothetical protein